MNTYEGTLVYYFFNRFYNYNELNGVNLYGKQTDYKVIKKVNVDIHEQMRFHKSST